MECTKEVSRWAMTDGIEAENGLTGFWQWSGKDSLTSCLCSPISKMGWQKHSTCLEMVKICPGSSGPTVSDENQGQQRIASAYSGVVWFQEDTVVILIKAAVVFTLNSNLKFIHVVVAVYG